MFERNYKTKRRRIRTSGACEYAFFFCCIFYSTQMLSPTAGYVRRQTHLKEELAYNRSVVRKAFDSRTDGALSRPTSTHSAKPAMCGGRVNRSTSDRSTRVLFVTTCPWRRNPISLQEAFHESRRLQTTVAGRAQTELVKSRETHPEFS